MINWGSISYLNISLNLKIKFSQLEHYIPIKFNSFLLLFRILSHLRWHDHILKKSVVSKQRRGRGAEFSFLKSWKWGISSAKAQRRCRVMEIGLLLMMMLLLELLIWRLWKDKRGSTNIATKAQGFRHNCYIATWCHRARMRVRALVGRDHDWPIVGRPLHSLLHTTGWSSATVVAPIQTKILHDQKKSTKKFVTNKIYGLNSFCMLKISSLPAIFYLDKFEF